MEERVHPIPFRTRQLSSPSSMILRTLTWESRTTPRLYFQKPFRLAREGFCFARRQPGGKPFLKKGPSPGPPLPKTSPLIESLPQHAPLRRETARRRTSLFIPSPSLGWGGAMPFPRLRDAFPPPSSQPLRLCPLSGKKSLRPNAMPPSSPEPFLYVKNSAELNGRSLGGRSCAFPSSPKHHGVPEQDSLTPLPFSLFFNKKEHLTPTFLSLPKNLSACASSAKLSS